MYGPRRRRAVYSPFQRLEFLVFLVPVFFFVMAFVVISMTILPDVTRRSPPVLPLPPALRGNAVVSSKTTPPASFLCGHSMVGVASADWAAYCGGAGEFVCRLSREVIASAQVNDDYCDCEDGSDEVAR